MDTAPAATLPREEQADDETRERVYVSPHAGLEITIRPKDDVPFPAPGGKTQWKRVPGKRATFTDGMLRTSDPEIIEFLKNHSRAGVLFRDVTAEQPKPPSGPVLQDIVTLTGRRDTEALKALLQEERRGHQREDVLLGAERALEVLGEPIEPTGPAGEPEGASGPENAPGGPMGVQGASAAANAAEERDRSIVNPDAPPQE